MLAFTAMGQSVSQSVHDCSLVVCVCVFRREWNLGPDAAKLSIQPDDQACVSASARACARSAECGDCTVAWCGAARQGWMVAVDLEAKRVDVQFLLAVGGALEDPVERWVCVWLPVLAVLASACSALPGGDRPIMKCATVLRQLEPVLKPRVSTEASGWLACWLVVGWRAAHSLAGVVVGSSAAER